MTATNHAITGALIAVSINRPAIALPLAFFSHFAQDAIPHFGYAGHGGYAVGLKHRLTKYMMLIDPITGLFLLLVLLHYSVSFWVYAAAFLALCPDFEKFIAYFAFERRGKKGWVSPIGPFHTWIQWCERPWGVFMEVVWFLGGMSLLINLIK